MEGAGLFPLMTLLDPKLPNVARNVIVNHVLPDGTALTGNIQSLYVIS